MSEKKTIRAGAVCLLVSLLAALFFTACVSKAVNAADKIELGQKYLTELNYTEAVASFTEAIKLDPDNIQAYMGRAEAYMALGEYDKALADYRFISGTTENMPYTRALSYIGQAEVHEKMEQPARAVSDYGLAKALLKASDAGKAENVSEEDVSAKLVQVLYVHAALCETLKNYNTALEDYNDLLELGENTAAKRDEVLSQLGEMAEDENGLTDTEEPAAESTAEEPAEEPTEESAPGQEAASESESQSAKEETKPEEPASSSEQSQEEAASLQEEKITEINWVEETVKSKYCSNSVLLGAVGEQVTQNYLIGFPEKVDESHIAAENLDERVVYREENGRFIEVERMPGEEYEEQFASREEYLNRMLSETQLKGLAADLGVPEALGVRYTQSERAYWEAGGCWEIYVEIDADKKVVAAASVDAETGELTRNILTYNGSGYWEAE